MKLTIEKLVLEGDFDDIVNQLATAAGGGVSAAKPEQTAAEKKKAAAAKKKADAAAKKKADAAAKKADPKDDELFGDTNAEAPALTLDDMKKACSESKLKIPEIVDLIKEEFGAESIAKMDASDFPRLVTLLGASG